MANEITISMGCAWRKGGQVISDSMSESYTQVGNAAIGNVQTIGSTTEAIVFGEISGEKFLMFKNLAAKDTVPIIYVDKVTPVVPAAAPIKLRGTQGNFSVTTEDTWYAITDTGTADLGIVAIEA